MPTKRTKKPETYKCCGGQKSRGHKKNCRFRKPDALPLRDMKRVKTVLTFPGDKDIPMTGDENCSDPMQNGQLATSVEERSLPENVVPAVTLTPQNSMKSSSEVPKTVQSPTTKPSLAEKLRAKPAPAPHVVVEAYAGTGKTFTLIVGVARVFGSDALWQALIEKLGFEPQPSEEQQKVWDALAQSKGVSTITYAAFNKSIVTEFGEKWGWLVDLLKTEGVFLQFATINSLGYASVRASYPGCFIPKDLDKTSQLLQSVSGKDIWELRRQDKSATVNAVLNLVEVSKLTLAGWTEQDGFDPQVSDVELDSLCSHFDIELNGNRERVYEYVRAILRKSQEMEANIIDFNDQNWLPIVNHLPVSKVDLLLVDESQDLPRAKAEYARLLGRRIVIVGDVNQAIYGFAGADVSSIPRMKMLLGVEQSLRLTQTRRCGKAIVAEAQKIVKDFSAHESNCDGSVINSTLEKWAELAEDKDMVLCRVNAQLVSQALQLIKSGRKAVIRGRDFGTQLVKFVENLDAKNVPELVEKVQDWSMRETAKEQAKKFPSDSRLIAIQDKAACVCAFAEEALKVGDVVQAMKNVFAGKQCPKCRKSFNDDVEQCFQCRIPLIHPDGVLFSSIHRAKGLEANRVFFIRTKDAPCPHPMAKLPWEWQQEQNILYVGITRAIRELVWILN